MPGLPSPANSPPLPIPEPAFPAAPNRSFLAPGWVEPVALFLVVFVCMTGGWFFFRGPGSSIFGGTNQPGSKEAPAAVVADASRPGMTESPRIAPPPKENPVNRPAPAPIPVPEPMPPPPAPTPPAAPVPTPVPTTPPTPPPGNNMRTFAANIKPIFEAKCINCHGAGKKRGGLDVRTVASLLQGGDNGASIKPGNPAKSLLWETIDTNRMPPGPNKLTAAERKIVKEWIAGGAK
jgi:mono/diheme cytochrome c family protein